MEFYEVTVDFIKQDEDSVTVKIDDKELIFNGNTIRYVDYSKPENEIVLTSMFMPKIGNNSTILLRENIISLLNLYDYCDYYIPEIDLERTNFVDDNLMIFVKE